MDQSRKAEGVKLFISPHPSEYQEDGRGSGGIWRVINAQARWLPEYGIEIVDSEPEADVVCVHAGSVVKTSKPIVAVNHGLYWTGDMEWQRDFWLYNFEVIEALREAHKIITPSEWVAQAIRRGMKKSPVVIPHGIDIEDFTPQPHQGYVLWAKPRVDVVSDPGPMNELAKRVSSVNFVSTFGQRTQNVDVIGTHSYADFMPILAGAAVWLATTRETGDIASREAMALGIPILGWNWGATGELVRHKIDGYLAEPGNYDDLLAGLHYCLDNRDVLGRSAREDIKAYQWHNIMAEYATVFQSAINADQYSVEVSVIVPTFNYARYLAECLESAIDKQPDAPTMEIVVVDDASTDNTQEILSHFGDINVIQHPSNGGLVASLNTGHNAARGRYIINLDADNVMATGAVRKLYDAMQARPWVDVGTGLYSIYERDTVNGGPVDYKAQLDHSNQIPSTCIIRSRSIRHIGGYRARQTKNEDAEFWCRAMSAGLRCEYVVEDPVFAYRWHGKNKSALEGGEDEPDGSLSWNFYFPWRTFPDITPFGFLGKSEQGSWPVRSYENPHIAVIIPCGPGHEHFLVDALDSVYAQTFQEFECIVANDTGAPLDVAAMGHPWVKVIDTGGRKGAAIARNTAIEVATAPLIIPLDADDMFYPDTVWMYYRAWLAHPENIVYGDCFTEDEPGKLVHYTCGKWSIDRVNRQSISQNVILFAKEWWEFVGGYPTGQYKEMWEDWLFSVKLAHVGIGGTYVERPWGVYRHWTCGDTGVSKNDVDSADYNTPEYKEKYQKLLDWIEDWRQNVAKCRGCGGTAKGKVFKPFEYRGSALPDGEQMQVICIAPQQGFRSLNSRATRAKKYRFKQGTVLTLDIGDEWVARHKDFERYIPDVPSEGAAEQLPQAPPKVERLSYPVKSKVPVTVARKPVAEPKPEAKQEPAPEGVDDLDLSDTIKEKLTGAGFKNAVQLRDDIRKTAGKRIKAIKGIGPAALVQIREAVFG